jgi:hypothetical protein
VFTPLALLGRIATITTPPRTRGIRHHGVFAPHSAARAAIVPQISPDAAQSSASTDTTEGQAPSSPPLALLVPATVLARRLDWATLLERVFAIDVMSCAAAVEGAVSWHSSPMPT